MKSKALNALLIITSLVGYLEWGQGSTSFLFQAEYEFLKLLFTDLKSAAHPFTLIPLLGQLVLLTTLFQKEPGKIMTYFGMACLGLLLGFMFLIGLMAVNFKILLSTLPFLVTMGVVIRNFRRK